MGRRAAMTEERARPASEHRRQAVAVLCQLPVADAVHTEVHAVEPAREDPRPDPARADSERGQLTARDHAVLAVSHPSDAHVWSI